jgi:Ca2+/H+ antiporter
MLGLALLLGAAVARGWILGTRVWAIVGIVMAVLILAAAVIWALNLPLAFRSVQEPAARLGLKKSVAKSIAQAILYPVAFLWIGWQGLRHSRAQR